MYQFCYSWFHFYYSTFSKGWSKAEFEECPDCGELYHRRGMGQHRIFCSCATKEESGRRGRAHDVLLRKRENNAKTEKEEIGMEIETENNDDDDDDDDDFHCIREAISAASKLSSQAC
jgi:hypothetical protein